jgi:hypothetical protein
LEKITLRIAILKAIWSIFFGSIVGLVVAIVYWTVNDDVDLSGVFVVGGFTSVFVSWSGIVFGIIEPLWKQHNKDS